MELRHVKRTGRRRRRMAFSPALIPVCLVFVAVVYGIGVSKFGTWLASRVVAPLLTSAAPVPTSANAAERTSAPTPASEESQRITLPSLCCYAVQLGVYAEEENAKAQADKLVQLGAAGYIVEDDGRYRVLAAGYPEKTDMEKVRAQLSAEGVDSRPYEILTDGMRVSAAGTASRLTLLEEALAFSASLPERLSELAIRFDRDSVRVADGGTEADALMRECARFSGTLTELDGQTLTALAPVALYLDETEQQLSLLLEADEDVSAFSSALKRLYLDTVYGYQRMAASMETA